MRCPRCGSDVFPDDGSTLDLCPACLLSAALAGHPDPCPYRIVAPLAEGRGGTTYLAQRRRGGGLAALKIFTRRSELDQILRRYERLKPAISRVRHAAVAPLLDAGTTDDDLLFVSSRFVPGWPLSAIDSHGFGAEGRAEIARQLTAAVAAIHAAGLAHLAINAANVRISAGGVVRASLIGLGTRLIVDGLAPSPEADRFALDSVLRQLLGPAAAPAHPG